MKEKLRREWEEALRLLSLKISLKKGYSDYSPYYLENLSFSAINRPQLVILSGPTGVGKGVVGRLLEEKGYQKFPNVYTRPPRPGERVGVDLISVTEEEFKRMERKGEFLIINKRHGYYHGFPRSFLAHLEKGEKLYLDKSVPSAKRLVSLLPADCSLLLIYLLPPSFEELWRRITTRTVKKNEYENPYERLFTSFKEMKEAHFYHFFLVNDELSRIKKLFDEFI